LQELRKTLKDFEQRIAVENKFSIKTGSNNMNEVSKRSENRQFYKKMLWIAGPVMLQQAINLSVNLTDNIMVGKLQEEAISGVASAISFIFCSRYFVWDLVVVRRLWSDNFGARRMWNGFVR